MPVSRRGLTVGLLTSITAVAFEAQAVLTAMPAAAADLGQVDLYAWAFTAFLIPEVVAVVAAGRLSDAIGPVKPLAAGLLICAVGASASALAPTMPFLLLGRFIQGLGAGAVNLTLMVVVGRAYPPNEQARLMTVFSAAWILPSLVGPVVAAWLTENLSWHWVFWGVLPLLMVGAAMMAPHLASLPRPESDADANPVSLAAATGAAVGIALLQAAGQRLEPLSAVLAVIGIALLGWLVPKLMPTTFRWVGRGLDAAVGTRTLAAGAFFGLTAFLPLMLVEQRKLPLGVAGASIAVSGLGWMVGSWLQSRPWLRWRRDVIVTVGVCVVTAGMAFVAVTAFMTAWPEWTILAGFTLASVGMGLQVASTSLVVMQLSPEAELGRNTSSLQVGELMGSAVLAGFAGTLFAFSRVEALPNIFVAPVAAMALLASLSIGAALRIGPVENRSLRL